MAVRRKPAEATGTAPLAHLQGLGLALILTTFLLIGLSLVVTATSLTEGVARWFMVAGGSISIMVGSSQTGRRIGKAGWLNGGLTGLAYALVLILLALLLDLPLSSRSLITLVAGFILGAAGGVFGVNRRI